jgi:hypothetical protein
MPRQDSNRARRQEVAWPARVRAKDRTEWHDGRVLNLSVTGALLQIEHRYPLGELVEVEIDFLNRPDSQTVVAGSGYVVREHRPIPNSTAVHFETGCSIARRRAREKPPATMTFRDRSALMRRAQDFASLARFA